MNGADIDDLSSVQMPIGIEDGAIKDHLAVVTVEPDGTGGSLVSVRQFFNSKRWSLKGKIIPVVMKTMLNRGLSNLKKELSQA